MGTSEPFAQTPARGVCASSVSVTSKHDQLAKGRENIKSTLKSGQDSENKVRAKHALRSWTDSEKMSLCKFATMCTKGRYVDWCRVFNSWKLNEPDTWRDRTKEAYKSMLRDLRASGYMRRDVLPSFDGGDLISSRLPSEEGSVVTEAVVVERGTTRAQFESMLDQGFEKAKRSTDRKPLGRVSRRVQPEWIAWGNTWCEAKLTAVREENTMTRLLVLNAAAYAVGSAVKEITTKVPMAMNARLKDLRGKLSLRMAKVRKELGHVYQELRRRSQGASPTRRQTQIIIALRKSGLNSRSDLEGEISRLKLRLLKIRRHLSELDDESDRRKVRGKPVSNVVTPKNNAEGDMISPETIREYWLPVVGTRKDFTVSKGIARWAKHLPSSNGAVPSSAFDYATAWREVLIKAKSWTAPGPDGIQAFWIKNLPAIGSSLFGIFMELLNDPKAKLSNWLCKGRIVTIPKKGCMKDPANYRPIACLNTSLKLFDGLIASSFRQRFEEIVPQQQMAMRRDKWGCIHAHAVDQSLLEDARQNNVVTHCAWIDYAKAFDSIPHAAIEYILKNAGFPELSAGLYLRLMKRWEVRYETKARGRVKRSMPLKVKCGVLQGDTLSPMMFCLAIAPISYDLERRFQGYRMRSAKTRMIEEGSYGKVTHMFYMDDLKLYSESASELEACVKRVERMSSYLNLKLNKAKCASVEMWANHPSRRIPGIPMLGVSDFYRYLGIEQDDQGNSDYVKVRVWDTVLVRFRKVWSSMLSFHEKVNATNNSVMPVLRYLFVNCFSHEGNLASMRAKANEWDSELYKELVKCGNLVQTCNRGRVHLPSDLGGFGMASVRDVLEDSVVYAYAYVTLESSLAVAYDVFQTVGLRKRGSKRTVISDMCKLVNGYKTISVNTGLDFLSRKPMIVTVRNDSSADVVYPCTTPRQAARCIVKALQNERNSMRLDDWRNTLRAGNVIKHSELSFPLSFNWLVTGFLNSKAVATACALQEFQVQVRAYSKDGEDSRGCRWCADKWETMVHVVAGCPKFRLTIMLDRHDDVARQLHHALCAKFALAPPHWRKPVPKVIGTKEAGCEIWWNPVVDVSKVRCNRPDMIVINHQRKEIWIVDVTVCWYGNIRDKEDRKLGKYSINGNIANSHSAPLPFPSDASLARDLSSLYRYAVEVVPVALGVCGEVSQRFPLYLGKLGFASGEIGTLTAKLQRSAVLGTVRLVRAHLARQ